MHGCINPLKRTAGCYWNVALDPWNPLAGKVKNKKVFKMGDKGQGRLHWKVDYCMPEMHGSIEKSNTNSDNNNIGGGGHMVERDMHTDVGYAHASIPRLEVVFWPLSPRLDGGGGGEKREGDGNDGSNSDASPSSITIRKGDELENFFLNH
jgi:hypothetical protein